MGSIVVEARYPNEFDLVRLTAAGDPQYLEASAAQQRYEARRRLRVVSATEPTEWYLAIAPAGERFALTFYSEHKAPLREAHWEAIGGELICRRIVDIFYPEGVPQGRIPYSDLFTVTQTFSADGVLGVSFASPISSDEYTEYPSADDDRRRVPLPGFGEWGPLLRASAPPKVQRFGLDSIDSAIALVNEISARHQGADGAASSTTQTRWRVPVGSRAVLQSVRAVLAHRSTDSLVPVLKRPGFDILPLAVETTGSEANATSNEGATRLNRFANELRDALEHEAGRGISLLTDRAENAPLVGYAAELVRAGVSRADYWVLDDDNAVVLVRSLTDQPVTPQQLSIHVVPRTWVGPHADEISVPTHELEWARDDVAK